MTEDVAPVLQTYVIAPVAVRSTEPPEQKVVDPEAETDTVNAAGCVIETDREVEQSAASVAVTV